MGAESKIPVSGRIHHGYLSALLRAPHPRPAHHRAHARGLQGQPRPLERAQGRA